MPLLKNEKLSKSTYLFKTIRLPPKHIEFWNCFLAGVTQSETHTNDPIAHLHLRNGHREPYTLRSGHGFPTTRLRTPEQDMVTYGMVRRKDPSHPGSWIYRNTVKHLVDNPNVAERSFRPVVHASPMYTPEEKRGYSKPQSTTLVSISDYITPRLFGGINGTECLCGAFFPRDSRFFLLNKVLFSDVGTYPRPFDGELFHSALTTYEGLLQEPRVKGPNARYTEIVARLCMYHPEFSSSLQSQASFIPPGLFVSYQAEKKIFLESVLMTLKRAFDLKFCLFRKFQITDHSIPIVVYQNDASDIDSRILGPIFFTGHENIIGLIDNFIHDWQSEFESKNLSSTKTLKSIYQELLAQQGLFRYLTNQQIDLDPNWDAYLRNDPADDTHNYHLFYIETLRAFIQCCRLKPEIQSILSSKFKKLFCRFETLDVQASEQQYNLYAFYSDVGKSNNVSYLKKQINVRFPLNLPNHEFRSILHRYWELCTTSREDWPLSTSAQQLLQEMQSLLEQPKIIGSNSVLQTTTAADECYFVNKCTILIKALEISQHSGYRGCSLDPIIIALINHPSINVNKPDFDKTTPIMAAFKRCSRYFNPHIINALLARGANLNAQDRFGDTIMHYIAKSSSTNQDFDLDTQFYDFLWQIYQAHQIFPIVMNLKNQTPLDLAIQSLKLYQNRCLKNLSLSRYRYDSQFNVDQKDGFLFTRQMNFLIRFFEYLKNHRILFNLSSLDGYFNELNGFENIQNIIIDYKISLGGSFTTHQEKCLKHRHIEFCFECKKQNPTFGKRHHCRRCLNGFCHNCIKRVQGIWTCRRCSLE